MYWICQIFMIGYAIKNYITTLEDIRISIPSMSHSSLIKEYAKLTYISFTHYLILKKRNHYNLFIDLSIY